MKANPAAFEHALLCEHTRVLSWLGFVTADDADEEGCAEDVASGPVDSNGVPESKGCTTKLCALLRVAVYWQCNSNVNNEFVQLQRACSDARRQCAEKTTVPARTTLHEYRDRRSGKDAEAEKWRSEKFEEVVHSPLMK